MNLLKNIGISIIYICCLFVLVYTFIAFFISILKILFFTQ